VSPNDASSRRGGKQKTAGTAHGLTAANNRFAFDGPLAPVSKVKIGGRNMSGRLGKAFDVLGNVETNLLAFPDSVRIIAVNRIETEENILSFVAANKTGADFTVEPFYPSHRHREILPPLFLSVESSVIQWLRKDNGDSMEVEW
jgi:hypothetical protein